MAPLDGWYERIDVDAVLALARKQKTSSLRTVERLVTQARHHTSLTALPKLTELVDGQRRIIEDPPLILHAEHEIDVPRRVIEGYVDSMSPERRTLLERYRIVDAARKVVGVGSVGTRCHVVLLMDPDDGAPALPAGEGSRGIGARPPHRAVGALVLIITVSLALAMLVGKIRDVSFILGIVATLLFIAVPVVAWLFVSWHMPHPDDLPWTALVPGALFLGLGLEVLHVITVYWIAHLVESKTDTYGALGFALAMLLWAYLLGRLVTTAAVINESLWSRYQERQQARPNRR